MVVIVLILNRAQLVIKEVIIIVVQQMGLKVVLEGRVFIINRFIFKVLATRDILNKIVSCSLKLSGRSDCLVYLMVCVIHKQLVVLRE